MNCIKDNSGASYIIVHITEPMGRDFSVGRATRYWLDGPGIEFRWWTKFSLPVQTGPGAHPASCTTGTGSFPGVNRTGCGADHPFPSKCRGNERVGLYIYSPSGPQWAVIGWTFTFTLQSLLPPKFLLDGSIARFIPLLHQVQHLSTRNYRYSLRNNPEERSSNYGTTQIQHSTGPSKMYATGHDPEPFISGGKQQNLGISPILICVSTFFLPPCLLFYHEDRSSKLIRCIRKKGVLKTAMQTLGLGSRTKH